MKPTEQLIADLLIKHGKTLCVAESCTGGLVSSMLTDISGSSSYTKVNFVTYANEAKEEYLEVKKETLQSYGAVSEDVAKEMAMGLIAKTGCDFALSTTGIAGPEGGSQEKQVGLVYIGIATKEMTLAYKYNANSQNSRKQIKNDFANKALEIFYNFLKEKLQ